ncbi:hypothetical protein B0J17DRAFT_709008 [Rhizoctonia solani]|nr:hypothetical protein B0J17DRAFT_709008 [Rhizoctonia solani]
MTLPSTVGSSVTMTNCPSASNQNNVPNIDTSDRSSLVRSLTGILRPRYRILTNEYPAPKEHNDNALSIITPESTEHDLKGMRYWVHLLDPNPDLRRIREADNKKVRTTLKATRTQPTLVYGRISHYLLNTSANRENKVAGHTETQTTAESPSVQLAYAPADYLSTSLSGSLQLITYETMRQWLLNDRHSAALVFITEVCFCENFLRLPYVLELNGEKAQWKKTDYHGSFEGGSSDIVHFAATSPGERAIWFNGIGAVFTKAFYNIDPIKPLSLKCIAEQLQRNLNQILSERPQQAPQHPKVYSSRMILNAAETSRQDEPHFFATLGFCSPSSMVETDPDSRPRRWTPKPARRRSSATRVPGFSNGRHIRLHTIGFEVVWGYHKIFGFRGNFTERAVEPCKSVLVHNVLAVFAPYPTLPGQLLSIYAGRSSDCPNCTVCVRPNLSSPKIVVSSTSENRRSRVIMQYSAYVCVNRDPRD